MSSLQEWLNAQREALAAERTEVIPVPGYEARLAGRYQLLHLRKTQEIMGKTTDELERAADTLIWSCIELLEIVGKDDDGKPIYQSTGCKWTRDGVRKLLGLDLPDEATSRDAVFAVFPPPAGEYLLYGHYLAIGDRLTAENLNADEMLLGNSDARSASEEPSISR